MSTWTLSKNSICTVNKTPYRQCQSSQFFNIKFCTYKECNIGSPSVRHPNVEKFLSGRVIYLLSDLLFPLPKPRKKSLKRLIRNASSVTRYGFQHSKRLLTGCDSENEAKYICCLNPYRRDLFPSVKTSFIKWWWPISSKYYSRQSSVIKLKLN
jgi:hypothetical protein